MQLLTGYCPQPLAVPTAGDLEVLITRNLVMARGNTDKNGIMSEHWYQIITCSAAAEGLV